MFKMTISIEDVALDEALYILHFKHIDMMPIIMSPWCSRYRRRK